MSKPEKCVCGVKDCPKCKAYKAAVKKWIDETSHPMSFEEREFAYKRDVARQAWLKWRLLQRFPADDDKLGIA